MSRICALSLACAVSVSAAMAIPGLAAASADLNRAVAQLRDASQLQATVKEGNTRIRVRQDATGQQMLIYVYGKLRRVTYAFWAQKPVSGQASAVSEFYSRNVKTQTCYTRARGALPWTADVTPFLAWATEPEAVARVTPAVQVLSVRGAGAHRVRLQLSRQVEGRAVTGEAVLGRQSGRLMRLTAGTDNDKAVTSFQYALPGPVTRPASVC